MGKKQWNFLRRKDRTHIDKDIHGWFHNRPNDASNAPDRFPDKEMASFGQTEEFREVREGQGYPHHLPMLPPIAARWLPMLLPPDNRRKGTHREHKSARASEDKNRFRTNLFQQRNQFSQRPPYSIYRQGSR